MDNSGATQQLESLAERFWERVKKTETCWLWTGALTRGGYGTISSGKPKYRVLLAHKVSYAMHYGQIPSDLFVGHSCGVLQCVRPDHLVLGPEPEQDGTRGYCRPVSARFWDHVHKTDTCWLWTGATTRSGYGSISSGKPKYRVLLAHRLSYELHYGPIADDQTVHQRCGARLCVRPDHLVLGPADNLPEGHTATGTSDPINALA